MIGIGILTWRRAEYVRDQIIPALASYTVNEAKLAVSCNSHEAKQILEFGQLTSIGEVKPYEGVTLLGSGKNLGVAGGKNRIICWFLKNPGLQHLFLFEDDCEPIKKGWDQWYLTCHAATGVQAVTFQPDDFYGGVTSHGPRVPAMVCGQLTTMEAVGCHVDGMMMLSATRKAVEAVGGFHRNFEGVNGQEHSEWMVRANRAGMTPFTNCSFMGCQEWIDGIDYREWRHSRGLPGGELRPEGDPATAHVFGLDVYNRGREIYFRTKKTHRIGDLFQDPCWDEATAKEVVGP